MMKKTLLTIALCTFASFSYVKAQEAIVEETIIEDNVSESPRVKFGIKAGGNVSGIMDFNNHSAQRFGLQGGVFVELPLGASDVWYLRPEVLFSAQGETNRDNRVNGTRVNEDYYLNYINVPVLLRAYFAKSHQGAFFAELGPQIGFLVWKDVESTTMKDDDFKTIDLAGSFGVGYSFGRKLEINVRYTQGFIDTVDNDGKGVSKNESTNFTSMASFGVAYTF